MLAIFGALANRLVNLPPNLLIGVHHGAVHGSRDRWARLRKDIVDVGADRFVVQGRVASLLFAGCDARGFLKGARTGWMIHGCLFFPVLEQVVLGG